MIPESSDRQERYGLGQLTDQRHKLAFTASAGFLYKVHWEII